MSKEVYCIWNKNFSSGSGASGIPFGMHVALQIGDTVYSYGEIKEASSTKTGGGCSKYPIKVYLQTLLSSGLSSRDIEDQTVYIGNTTKTTEEIRKKTSEIEDKGYDLFFSNCCHFADELSKFVCGKHIPQIFINQTTLSGLLVRSQADLNQLNDAVKMTKKRKSK